MTNIDRDLETLRVTALVNVAARCGVGAEEHQVRELLRSGLGLQEALDALRRGRQDQARASGWWSGRKHSAG